jgi:hypothetical protein
VLQFRGRAIRPGFIATSAYRLLTRTDAGATTAEVLLHLLEPREVVRSINEVGANVAAHHGRNSCGEPRGSSSRKVHGPLRPNSVMTGLQQYVLLKAETISMHTAQYFANDNWPPYTPEIQFCVDPPGINPGEGPFLIRLLA